MPRVQNEAVVKLLAADHTNGTAAVVVTTACPIAAMSDASERTSSMSTATSSGAVRGERSRSTAAVRNGAERGGRRSSCP